MIDLTRIPNKPGCYLFKDRQGHIIYIGKAKNLKKRVASYFYNKDLDRKTLNLVKSIESTDFIVTNSEVEALILENNLIKKHTPRYNIDLKDSKRYAYIQLTDEDFPRLLLARRISGEGKFFGPFTSAAIRDQVLSVLRKTFLLRTCKKMPKRPCLRYQINLCRAPCAEHILSEEYAKLIKKVTLVLKGKGIELIKKLETEMKVSAKKQQYETALELRNQIHAIKYLEERQNVERQKRFNEDIINFIIKADRIHLLLFNVYKGILENKQEFEFDFSIRFLEEFLVQYYSENTVPKEIILPKKISDSLVEFLELKKGGKVSITTPLIGEKKQLLALVKKNIELNVLKEQAKMDDLRIKLKFEDMPRVIECFDISHISGTSTVGSMVQFRDGKPDKSNYRRFKIKNVEGIDDFKALAEVVRRRYSRLLNEQSEMPDLIIIDGGKGQLSSAVGELNKLGLRIPTISIAKRYEEIYFPGLSFPKKFDKKSLGLRFIQAIRDEAHRFAIKYNRLLRSKEIKQK